MTHTKQVVLTLAVLASTLCGVQPIQAHAARTSGEHGLLCVVDIVVETRNQAGVLVGTEVYFNEFILEEGGSFFDDFSTRTRFKFFDATFQKVDGEKIVSFDWFADVTVFNSVDFGTTVTLINGSKSGKSTGAHTLYTSSGSTTTRYTLTCVVD